MPSQTVIANRELRNFDGLSRFQGHFCNREVVVRLINFWRARNSRSDTFMGIELLLLDSKSNSLQGYIPASRLSSFEPGLEANSLYKLKKFKVQSGKKFYNVADHECNIIFTNNTSFVPVSGERSQFDTQKFRIRSFPEFLAIVDTKTQLFDVIGEIRFVAGDNLRSTNAETRPLQFQDNRSKDKVFLHLLMKGGETIPVRLSGHIASTFRARWNKNAIQPTVLLVTTVNPKTIQGALSLKSTLSTRLFFDHDITETQSFMTALGNGCFTVPVLNTSSSAITRLGTCSISEIEVFVQNEYPRSAKFFVHATVVDVLGDHGWNYISCSICNTRLGKTGTPMHCQTCGITNDIGVLRYRIELSVSDSGKSIATFVIFDRDATNILGKRAEDLRSETISVDNHPSVPTSIKNIIGKSFTFQLRVTSNHVTANRQFFPVSRIMEDNIQGEYDMTPSNINGDEYDGKTSHEPNHEYAAHLIE